MRDDVRDGRSGEAAFARVDIDGTGSDLLAALVNEHDEAVNSLLFFEIVDDVIYGGGFGGEFQAGDAGRRDDRRRSFKRETDEGNWDAVERLNRVRREKSFAGALVEHVGREILKLGAFERSGRADFGAFAGVRVALEAAASLFAQQFGAPLIELVIPY